MSIQSGNLQFLTCFIELLQTVFANYSLNSTFELDQLFEEGMRLSFEFRCLSQVFGH